MSDCIWKIALKSFGILTFGLGIFLAFKREKKRQLTTARDIQKAKFNLTEVSFDIQFSSDLMIALMGIIIVVLSFKYLPTCEQEVETTKASKSYNNFSGRVVEEGSNTSIAGAQINIIGRSEKGYSESDGNFQIKIKDSTLNQIHVSVLKFGYKPLDESYDFPNESAVIVLQKQ